ncbi:branched-chain amino acid ABC transporter substrate-binding protein [Deinococcus metallilatus]|uniref:Branched-chain amino acid ABC transporter substrate-binding protein n=1 Tax=Deinococcus metallilatus TaxID=1211322 RepID=A0AAJ5K4N7_9DEIO|nr:branched-chain amino acid ABC transporter substrate-binding protein [Deinococcus metallilatus]MBB5295937.1 branched-chain amino acid transport system substrate-binding protein [Deinococcus metallilatus]QBY08232.1 branched-chain amino acid ABC transporter substrate-binding protein [Deinococcus metallilatus]RXJ11963.1 branched-chain amino acid ABC transporter substrate-binding protein [Deinococcus metallilatus]TLK25805.1 branched-chain amino acid ABC transporter substrate-binding protein [Dein
MKTVHRPLALLTALLLGSTLASTAGAQATVKIATIGPLSGPQSLLGTQMRNGVQLAVNEYKPQFKKLGMDLQLVAFDDQADPATGTAAARKIAADRQFLAVVGALNSGTTIPASAALAPSHVPLVSSSSTADQVTDRGLSNMNRIVPRDDAQGPAAADFIANTLKAKKVYVLNDKTAYGAGLANEVEKALKAKGIQVVANEGTEEKNDFSSIVAKIKLQRPDVVYFGGIYSQIGVFLKQLRDAGVTVPVMGGDGLDSSELPKIAGKGAENVYYTTTGAPVEAFPPAKTFAATYQKTFGNPAQSFAVLGYDAGKVVLQGILNAAKANGNKVPSREQVEAAIRKGNFTSLLSGNVSFNSAGDRTSAKLYVIKLVGGKPNLDTTLTVKPAKS